MTNQFENIVLYRMVTPEKICPYGLKAKVLFEQKGWSFEDNHLKTRAETDIFKTKYNLQKYTINFHRCSADR